MHAYVRRVCVCVTAAPPPIHLLLSYSASAAVCCNCSFHIALCAEETSHQTKIKHAHGVAARQLSVAWRLSDTHTLALCRMDAFHLKYVVDSVLQRTHTANGARLLSLCAPRAHTELGIDAQLKWHFHFIIICAITLCE